MSECKKCRTVSESLEGELWGLRIETQRCIWKSPEALPEVGISGAYTFMAYCCEAHALKGVQEYLFQVGANALWSDVRPIETCACCGQDFDATAYHKVLVLAHEVIDKNEFDLIDIRYPARFCIDCVP
jgi:hypothetical protein